MPRHRNKTSFQKGLAPWNKGKPGYKHKPGRVATLATRRILSEAKKGKPSLRKGAKNSAEHRRKISLANRLKPRPWRQGENAWNWKGGVTPLRTKIWHSIEYKLWRNAVFERDNYTCVWCGQRGKILNADHIKPFAHYPELRFAIDNGRTLCKNCHLKTDNYGGRIRRKK